MEYIDIYMIDGGFQHETKCAYTPGFSLSLQEYSDLHFQDARPSTAITVPLIVKALKIIVTIRIFPMSLNESYTSCRLLLRLL